MYFVSYEFDDNIHIYGSNMYCYEVDINTRNVNRVTGNKKLESKYIELGFLDKYYLSK
jgi:hypothetical protein